MIPTHSTSTAMYIMALQFPHVSESRYGGWSIPRWQGMSYPVTLVR